jgi:hypothetical protein
LLKHQPANRVTRGVDQITAAGKTELKHRQYRPTSFDSFLGQTGLSLPQRPP